MAEAIQTVSVDEFWIASLSLAMTVLVLVFARHSGAREARTRNP